MSGTATRIGMDERGTAMRRARNKSAAERDLGTGVERDVR
jgi:hypothetical protein